MIPIMITKKTGLRNLGTSHNPLSREENGLACFRFSGYIDLHF
jgi:hypothetical protein